MPISHPPSEHFKGKSVPEHLKEARIKGAKASAEIHGTEISGQNSAFADALKDASLALALLWVLLSSLLTAKQALYTIGFFSLGWVVWKTARSACFGWARLERLHNVIEEERWEIEHHRQQEREELFELYRAKGFEGQLLTQVVDVLMADDNRLLEIMLEEELGIPLEAYEHPLQQAFGAFLGAFLTFPIAFGAYLLFPTYGFISSLSVLFLLSGMITAKIEKASLISSLIWNMAIMGLSLGVVHFIKQFVIL